VIGLVALLLARTTLGRSMRALADDAVLAAVTGIRVDRVVVATWALAGVLAGIAGVLAALVQSSFDPNVGFTLLLAVFAAVVLGGIGSAYGALLGGLVLGVLTEVATWTALGGGVNPVYKPVVAFTVLIVALLFRPQGLLGRARIL
jgi:branched-subunit amino acid ABC-type transport system permease component